MADELVDIFDEHMTLIGQEMKSKAHREGLWHKCFHCWIVKKPNKIWFQLRGKDKEVFPDMLDISAAGHLGAGEAPEDGVRESEEEISLTINPADLQKSFIFPEVLVFKNKNMYIREFYVTYLYETEKELRDLKMQPEEVDGVFEADINEVYDLFFGKATEIKVVGLVRNDDKSYSEETRVVGIKDFAPHEEEYYRKVFVAAREILK